MVGLMAGQTVSELYGALEDDNEHTLCVMLQAVAARDHLAVRSLARILANSRDGLSAPDCALRSAISASLPQVH